jgi:mono/diheme cytochrome c family protein
MNKGCWLILLGVLTMAAGCDDMHRQPSVQPQEAPRLSAPAQAVPVTGVERLAFGQTLQNPLAVTPESRRRGAALYAINCLPCHGSRDAHPGRVGALLQPPPPPMRDGHLRDLDEATLYQLISLGFGRMPPFQQRLTAEERWQLVNYLRSDD